MPAMPLKLFEARALAASVRFLDAHGYHSEPLLDQLGIPAQMMKQGGWVSIDQFYKFASLSAQRVGSQDAILQAELEFNRSEHPFRQAVMKSEIEHEDGVVAVPNGPGLGIEINRAVLDRYRVVI